MTAGPLLVQGDCLAAVLLLHRDDQGVTHAPCPLCGVEATTGTDAEGRNPRLRIADGVAYGRVVLVPCGHEIGQITHHPDDVARWETEADG